MSENGYDSSLSLHEAPVWRNRDEIRQLNVRPGFDWLGTVAVHVQQPLSWHEQRIDESRSPSMRCGKVRMRSFSGASAMYRFLSDLA